MERENSKAHIDVSIIIVNYNSFDLLNNCLSSLVKYSNYFIYEVIVIDNNSVKGNIETITNQFDGVILIKNSVNEGFGRANNQGLRIAKGKYVLFLNNDTIFIENTIKSVFEVAESMSQPVIIGCKLLNADSTLQHSVYDFPSLLNLFTSNFFLYQLFPNSRFFNKYHLMHKKVESLREVDVVTGAFLFADRRMILMLNGFDERFFFYNEETELCYRFKKSGGKIYYFPDTKIIHLKGGTANKESWFAYKYQSISTIKFFQKHFRGIKFITAIIMHYMGLVIRIPIFFIIGFIAFDLNLIKRSIYYLKLLFVYPKNLFKDN